MKRTLLAASVAVFLFCGLAEVLYAAPDLRREELLGQREVDFRADNDVIEVGRSEGRFQKIRLVVRGAPVELRDMKVVFDDDSVFDVARRSRILRENSDFVIDLPGDRRVIKRIAFQYRSVNRREGKATVLVYGDHGREIRRDSRREELLGQREVDFRADNDVIEVGRSEGRFQKLRLIVRGAPIELRDMKVVFDDDSVFDVSRRSRVLRENSNLDIDLPGDRRVIKRITFQYRSVDRREGKATVLVYGRH
jgi:translation initiation factor IF-1